MGQILFENGRAAEADALSPPLARTRAQPAAAADQSGARATAAQRPRRRRRSRPAAAEAVIAREPDNAFAWRELAPAREVRGERALAELASAEQNFSVGDYPAALSFAERARRTLAAQHAVLSSAPTTSSPSPATKCASNQRSGRAAAAAKLARARGKSGHVSSASRRCRDGALSRRRCLALIRLGLAPAAAAQSFNAQEQAEIRAIVRDYLVRNPDVLREALDALQERANAERWQRIKSDPRDFAIGPANAPITIVEFFDYRCAYCHAALEWVVDLARTRRDVRVVFKELPILGAAIDGSGARLARRHAARALCAVSPGADGLSRRPDRRADRRAARVSPASTSRACAAPWQSAAITSACWKKPRPSPSIWTSPARRSSSSMAKWFPASTARA